MKSWTKVFLTILLCLLGHSALAAPRSVEIDDFMHILDRLERSLRPVPFAEAFQCGQSAKIHAAKDMCSISCEPWGAFSVCQMLCIPVDLRSEMITVEVVNCSEESATLFSSDGDIQVITASDYQRYHSNPLRQIFEQIPNWLDGVYKVSIYSMKRGEHTLGWKTENERKIPAWYLEGQITYRGDNGSEDAIDVIFTLVEDESVPWFARAARVRITRDGTMWRLDEI